MEALLAKLDPVGHGWYRIPEAGGGSLIELVIQHTPDDVALRWGDYLRVIDGRVVAWACPAGDTTEIRLADDTDDEPIRHAVPRAWAAHFAAASSQDRLPVGPPPAPLTAAQIEAIEEADREHQAQRWMK